ncbi:hypothetical protein [Paenibacillus sp. RC67]|uniref:hypothetical protein n=1 Tax=Paenibacillus sp. RC67 TaxID=3039392 RepID=UPI0024AE3D4D|nr:hypothetical protein [Paenibacillus sp. RC67]
MVPIYLNEIPNEFNHYLGSIKDITFPRQGHTSDVGIIQSEHGKFVLKRTKGEQYSTWLSEEVGVLKSLSVAPLSTPKVYHFVEQKSEDQAWALMEFLKEIH